MVACTQKFSHQRFCGCLRLFEAFALTRITSNIAGSLVCNGIKDVKYSIPYTVWDMEF